ncbi:MAG: hypothetical protein V1746_03685 [bacterium]
MRITRIRAQRGAALVAVLSLIAVLTALLAAYFALTEQSYTRAAGSSENTRSRWILEAAAQEALAKIMDGGELDDPLAAKNASWKSEDGGVRAPAHMTVCPGLMSVRCFNRSPRSPSDGNPFDSSANPRLIPLFSYAAPTADTPAYFNINTLQNPFHPGEFYLSGYPEASGADDPVSVQWMPVGKDPALPPSASNPLAGRYAYWVDVENSKINLHAAFCSWDEAILPTGVNAFSWWLVWNKTAAPRAADNSIVNWNALMNVQRYASANQRVKEVMEDWTNQRDKGAALSFNFWPEIYSLLDPSDSRTALAVMRKILGSSATLYGRDEERDPLGRAKIDLVAFQKQGVEGSLWNDLMRRLKDDGYHKAYEPNAAVNNGAACSLVQALSVFSKTNEAAGELAVKQMLVNIVEYAKPPDQPPYMSEAEGIIAAKSVPYIAEVAMRARSALWLLKPEDRAVDRFLDQNEKLRTDILTGWTPDGQRFTRAPEWFLTHVVADMAFAFANPNPYQERPFDGVLILDYEWDASCRLEWRNRANETAVKGSYQTVFSDHQWEANGDAAYFYTGILPGSSLESVPDAFRLKEWKIQKNGKTFHQVPFSYPRQRNDPRDWCAMAQKTANAGQTNDDESLCSFQTNGAAVGWFALDTAKSADNVIYIGSPHSCDSKVIKALIRSVKNAENSDTAARKASVVERVFCLDPTLGHRTGNTDLKTSDGRIGHFYGALGHPWRRCSPAVYSQGAGTLTSSFQDARVRDNFAQTPSRTGLQAEKLFVKGEGGDVEVDKEVNGFKLQKSSVKGWKLFRSAPRGEAMTSLGELGLVHSGLLQRPIPLVPSGKEQENCLDAPCNGPPLRMLLDIFTPGAYRNNRTGKAYSLVEWRDQPPNIYQANSPSNPRRGVWNVNTLVASLDPSNGGLVLRDRFQHGFDLWLKSVGGSRTADTNAVPALTHFNSEANVVFPDNIGPLGPSLIANQITTSANAFTIYAVAQLVRDTGKQTGRMDAGDQIVSEQWAQIVVQKIQDTSQSDPDTGAPFRNDYRILSYRVLNNSR